MLAETAQLAVEMNLRGNFRQGMAQAQTALGKTTVAASRFSSSIKDSILTGVGLGGGVAAFTLVTSTIGKSIDIMGDAVRAAAEEEAEIAQLTRAIEENDDAWDGNIDRLEDVIAARQDLAYSDSEQREALRLLIAQTHDLTEAQKLLGTAMDFARFRGIDLRTASDLLGKAYAGNFQTLSRYGVVLEKGATATEALAQIQRMAAGQASAYAATTQGKLVQAQIALDNALEELGAELTPVAAGLAQLATDILPMLAAAAATAADELKPIFALIDPAATRMGEWAEKAREQGIAAGLSSVEIEELIDNMENLDFWMSQNVEGIRDASSETERDAALQGMLNQRIAEGTRITYEATRATGGLGTALAMVREGFADFADTAQALQYRMVKLGDAMEHVASTSLSDVKSAAKATQEAIKEAAKAETWAALRKEDKALAAQRGKYMREGQYDVVAIIDARRGEIKQQIAMRRMNSLHYRADKRENRGRVQSINEVSKATEETTGKVEDLNAAISGDHVYRATVEDSQLDALAARLGALATFGVTIPIRTVDTGLRSGAGSVGGTPNVVVKPKVDISASAINRGTTHVRASRRSGDYSA